jgi:hypothetical protein
MDLKILYNRNLYIKRRDNHNLLQTLIFASVIQPADYCKQIMHLDNKMETVWNVVRDEVN